MVTHEHDLVRHFGGRIINITDGEIVYDEVVMGINDEILPEVELAQSMENAASAPYQTALGTEPNGSELPLIDDVIAAITGASQNDGGGAE